MLYNTIRAAAVAALALGADARLNFNNWCNEKVSVVISHNGGCDYGTDGRCIRDGSKPWVINSKQIVGFDWIANGQGTSLKLSREGRVGVLQFEYNVVEGQYGGLYWDLSDLDGSGNGLVGTPFRDANVKVSPTGNGSGQGTCVKIRCKANQVCLDSYQHPDDPNTKWCPTNTGDMWVDLCQPDAQFYNKREESPLVEAAARDIRAHAHAGRHIKKPFKA